MRPKRRPWTWFAVIVVAALTSLAGSVLIFDEFGPELVAQFTNTEVAAFDAGPGGKEEHS